MRGERHGFTLIELLVVVILVGILATLAMAQLDRTRASAVRGTVKSALREMAVQQEIYQHANGSYAPDPGPPDFVPTPNVTIEITFADQRGWAGIATHPGWPGKQCGIWVGTAPPALGAPATQEGVVECMDP